MLGYVVVTDSSKMSIQKTQNIMSHSHYMSLTYGWASAPSPHRDLRTQTQTVGEEQESLAMHALSVSKPPPR